jgi:hypothetical protein
MKIERDDEIEKVFSQSKVNAMAKGRLLLVNSVRFHLMLSSNFIISELLILYAVRATCVVPQIMDPVIND